MLSGQVVNDILEKKFSGDFRLGLKVLSEIKEHSTSLLRQTIEFELMNCPFVCVSSRVHSKSQRLPGQAADKRKGRKLLFWLQKEVLIFSLMQEYIFFFFPKFGQRIMDDRVPLSFKAIFRRLIILAGRHRARGHGGSQRGGPAVHPSRLPETDRHLSVYGPAGQFILTFMKFLLINLKDFF